MKITLKQLEEILIGIGIIQAEAIEDPIGYDEGRTKTATFIAMQEINKLLQCQDPTVERVVARLRSRSRTGVQKYGTTLANAGLSQDQLLRHLQEELLDAANYIEQILSPNTNNT